MPRRRIAEAGEMILEDVIVVCRTVPEQSKKYGHRVCVIGYSPELKQLIRIYPTEIKAPIKSRSIVRLHLEPNPDDSRKESYKMADAVEGILDVQKQRVSVTQLRQLLSSLVCPGINHLNSCRCSVGVLKAQSYYGLFKQRKTSGNGPQEHNGQLKLFFDDLNYHAGLQSDEIDVAPYVRFRDDNIFRELQFREWGAYEFLRKQRDKADQLWKAIGFQNDDILLTVGNMFQHRNVWMILRIDPVPIPAAQLSFFGNDVATSANP
jgi:hypothetical protein